MDELGVQLIDGYRMPLMFPADHIRSAAALKPRDSDLFSVTYPKTGTVWTNYIIWSIRNHGKLPLPSFNDLMKQAAGLEFSEPGHVDTLPSPRHMFTHLPYQLTPKSDKAKYIYGTRNPLDVVVSYYPFLCERMGLRSSFDAFFDHFVTGDIPYGDYFDHFLAWYEHKDDDNVLFMLYEDMLADHRGSVLKIAKFMSDDDTDYVTDIMANDGQILDAIVENTSFASMKKNVSTEMTQGGKTTKVNFFRKGTTGDGKLQLTDDQIRRLKEKMDIKFKDIDRASLGPHYN